MATGVAVGVATVIALMTLGASFEAYFVNQYNSTFATNSFTIEPQTSDFATRMTNSGTALYIFPIPVFSEQDVRQLQGANDVKTVIPYSVAGGGGTNTRILVDGRAVSTSYQIEAMTISPLIFSDGFLKLASGEIATTSTQVIVGYSVGLSIAYEVGSTNRSDFALGHLLTLQEGTSPPEKFTVVGVLKESPTELALNTMIYLPLLQSPSSDAAPVFNGVAVISNAPDTVNVAEQASLALVNSDQGSLTALRSAGLGLEFGASSTTGAASFLQQQVSEYTTVILAMGVVALFGGAAGVSNMMLVSVTERTKEIGTIKAIGGSRREIVEMFLAEAAMVSFIGAGLGIVGGAALGYALMRLPILGLQMPLVYNLPWFPIAAVIGLATGLIAGVYPAVKASRVLPVRALKYE
jgi:putative ABC transport system permease protein